MTPPTPAEPPDLPDAAELAAMPAALRARATRQRLAAGERLFLLGARPAAMFYVLDGEVRLVRSSAAGGEAIMQRMRRGFLAEGSLDARHYHCDAVAAEPSTLLRFPRPLFRRCLDEDTGFRGAWIAHLSREVRRLRAACERLTLRSAAERVLHFLESEGQDGRITLAQSRKAWAAELGLSHEALYRTLAQLEQAGRIAVAGRTIGLSAVPASAPR